MPHKRLGNVELSHLIVLNKAINLMMENQYRKALIMTQKALQIYPYNSDAYYLYSNCLFWNQKFQHSNRAYEWAIEKNPLCQIYQMPDKEACVKIKSLIQKAIQFEQIIQKQGQNLVVNTWYRYSILFHQQTNYQRVQSIYQRLFTKFPQIQKKQSHAFLGNYSNMLYDLGKYQKAISNYELQISRDQSQMRFYSNCALLYTIVGNYFKAEQYIKIALSMQPGKSNFLFNYATILAKMNKYQQSISKIQQALSKDTEDPIYNLKLAVTLYLRNQKINNFANFKYCLKKSIDILIKSLQKNSPQLVNSNKRILSIKNIQCVKIFAQMLWELQQIKQKGYKWNKQRQFLQLISDYFIVGQAGKIRLNYRFMQLLRQSNPFDQVSSNNEACKDIDNQQQQKKLQQFLNSFETKIMKICQKPQIVRLKQWPKPINNRFQFDEID